MTERHDGSFGRFKEMLCETELSDSRLLSVSLESGRNGALSLVRRLVLRNSVRPINPS